jgi:hypothetical protein
VAGSRFRVKHVSLITGNNPRLARSFSAARR